MTVVVDFTSSGTWTCPAGVTSAKVEVWGGGAGGRNPKAPNGAIGGGGGGYARTDAVPVTPGVDYAVVVGSGGAPAGSGGDSDFGAGIVHATGSTGLGTGGGTVGDVRTNGGAPGGATDTGGGGGGSSAGSAGNGNDGQPNSGATGGAGGVAPTGGWAGGKGGDGGQPGVDAVGYGGGGGGAGGGSTSGNGAQGLVRITYEEPQGGCGPPKALFDW